MDFENLIKSPILDEIWDNESGEFEDFVVRKSKGMQKFDEDSIIAEEIKKFAIDYIPKEKIEEYNNKWNEYIQKEMKKFEYWTKKYFKLGIINGIRIKNDLKEEIEENVFLTYEDNCFTEYLETTKINNLMNTTKYKDLLKRVTEIKEKHPRIIEFLEDRDAVDNLTEEEQDAIFEIMDIKERIHIIEQKEIFRMGMKEMKNILK